MGITERLIVFALTAKEKFVFVNPVKNTGLI
jgi:hypothetical protein